MRRELIALGIGLAFAVSPISLQLGSEGALTVLAAKGGNGGAGGNGAGGGNGGAGGGNAGGAAKGEAGAAGRDSAPGQNKEQGSSALGKGQAMGAGASSYGKLNGFMHASSTALAHASVSSPLGTIARIYAGQIGSYLAIDQTKATPEEIEAAQEKLESAALTLASVANKPLSQEVVASVNSRLGDLAKQNSLPGQDANVSTALSNLSSDDPAQKSRNETLAAMIVRLAGNGPALGKSD
jgi:hypothetical protein